MPTEFKLEDNLKLKAYDGDPTNVDATCRVECSSIGDINLLTWRANNALATGKIPTIVAFSPTKASPNSSGIYSDV